MSEPLTFNHFAPHIGEAFTVEVDDARIDLVLEEAQPLSGATRAAGAFKLYFLGPADPLLPQATYSIGRGDDRHPIFIVPVDRDAAATRYEAIFT